MSACGRSRHRPPTQCDQMGFMTDNVHGVISNALSVNQGSRSLGRPGSGSPHLTLFTLPYQSLTQLNPPIQGGGIFPPRLDSIRKRLSTSFGLRGSSLSVRPLFRLRIQQLVHTLGLLAHKLVELRLRLLLLGQHTFFVHQKQHDTRCRSKKKVGSRSQDDLANENRGLLRGRCL